MNLLFKSSLVATCLLSVLDANAQTDYFTKNDPGLVPRIFESGYISRNDRYEFGSVFTKDMTECYFAINNKNRSEIMYSKQEKGQWSDPVTIFAHPRFSFNDPFLSNDEQRLYFISDLSKGPYDESTDFDIWYSEKVPGGWSEPINAGDHINSSFHEYYISFTETGKIYFASNRKAGPERKHDFDIYSAEAADGSFINSRHLDTIINTKSYEADVFVAPDESYIIFVSFKESGLGEGDLYISLKDEKDNWSKVKNMGNVINSASHELCPFVTRDGKYLFYTSDENIYWVSSEILDQFRY